MRWMTWRAVSVRLYPPEPADATAPKEVTAEKQAAPRPKRPSLYHLSNDYGLTFAIISAISIIAGGILRTSTRPTLTPKMIQCQPKLNW